MADTRATGAMPDNIDGYNILRILGQGGMATVYAAQQTHPKRTVALKLMRPSIATPHMLRRFRKEIDLLARLRHPCIAQIYAAGVITEGGSELPYFVMEYIPQASTILEFASAHQLDRTQRLKLFVHVCAAVEHGHRQRILHLDLKPANVLIDNEGRVKVIDFGVARAIEQPAPGVTAATSDTAIMGSLHAMSPEQIDPAGCDLDPRSDVYSLGVLLYRLMLGTLPYELSSKSIVQAARTICETPAMKPCERDASIPADLESIMLRALEKDPQARFRHAGSLGKALLTMLENVKRGGNGRDVGDLPGPEGRETASASSGAVGRWIGVGAGVVLIAAIVFAVVLMRRGGSSNLNSTLPPPQDSGPGRLATTAPPTGFSIAPEHQKPFNLLGHTGLVASLSLNKDGDRLASVAQDRLVRLWNLDDRSMVLSLTGHEHSPIGAVALSSDGARIASGADDGSVIVHESALGRIVQNLALGSGPTHFLVYSALGDLAGASDDLTVHVWDTAYKQVATLRSTTGAVTAGAFAPDGTLFVGGTVRGTVYVWSIETGKQIERYTVGNEPITQVAVRHDGETITALSQRGVALVFDRRTNNRISRMAVAGDVPTALALDPEGEFLFVARQDRTIHVWSIGSSAQVVEPIDVPSTVVCMTYSVASKRLAMGFSDGAVRVMYLPLAAAQP